MNRANFHRIFPQALIIYMLLALLWWALLLFKKNSEVTTEKLRILQIESNSTYKVANYDIKSLSAYDDIITKHKRQQMMIIGEGLVFGISLILGMGFINRAFTKEIANNERQKNFLLSITHELKSPLASVGLILETIKRRKLDKGKLNDLADSALQENKRLEKQINNLLMATRLEEAYTFNFEKTDVSLLIEDLVSLYSKTYEKLSINLINNASDTSINIDREAFRSVITNLFDNAIKYAEKEPIIEVTLTNDEKQLKLKIRDEGIGIPKEERDKVMEQFYRIGNEETRKTKGTGLGLFIVKRIIDAHKGSLDIMSNNSKGSIFEILIPYKLSR